MTMGDASAVPPMIDSKGSERAAGGKPVPTFPQPALGRIEAVLVGRALPYTRERTFSAIAKAVVRGPVHIGILGLDGDEQGDPRVHGGRDKAVHHYPFEHYALWRKTLGDHVLLDRPGAFGENLSTLGMTEEDICVGDRLRAGGVVLEVSQPRQPCWKLADRFGLPRMPRIVQDELRTGWYYRVLEPGSVAAGDTVTLLERPFPGWPIRGLSELVYKRGVDRDLLGEAARLPLPRSWQKLINSRLSRGSVEDWGARLDGPAR
jgi:MOSC domain-containing protein YiiM